MADSYRPKGRTTQTGSAAFLRSGGYGRDVLVYLAALHDERHPCDGGDVRERIAVERDEVGFVAGRERANRLVQMHRLRGERRRRDDRVHRLLIALAHA